MHYTRTKARPLYSHWGGWVRRRNCVELSWGWNTRQYTHSKSWVRWVSGGWFLNHGASLHGFLGKSNFLFPCGKFLDVLFGQKAKKNFVGVFYFFSWKVAANNKKCVKIPRKWDGFWGKVEKSWEKVGKKAFFAKISEKSGWVEAKRRLEWCQKKSNSTQMLRLGTGLGGFGLSYWKNEKRVKPKH